MKEKRKYYSREKDPGFERLDTLVRVLVTSQTAKDFASIVKEKNTTATEVLRTYIKNYINEK